MARIRSIAAPGSGRTIRKRCSAPSTRAWAATSTRSPVESMNVELAQVDDDVLPGVEALLHRRLELGRGGEVELATDDDDRASVAVGDRDRESGRVERHAASDTLFGRRVVALEPRRAPPPARRAARGLRDVGLELAGAASRRPRRRPRGSAARAAPVGAQRAEGRLGRRGPGAAGDGRAQRLDARTGRRLDHAAASASTGAAAGAGCTASMRAPARRLDHRGCRPATTGAARAARRRDRLRPARGGASPAPARSGSDAAWAAAAAAWAAAAAASAARSTASARWAGVCESELTGAMLAWPHVALLDLDAGGSSASSCWRASSSPS